MVRLVIHMLICVLLLTHWLIESVRCNRVVALCVQLYITTTACTLHIISSPLIMSSSTYWSPAPRRPLRWTLESPGYTLGSTLGPCQWNERSWWKWWLGWNDLAMIISHNTLHSRNNSFHITYELTKVTCFYIYLFIHVLSIVSYVMIMMMMMRTSQVWSRLYGRSESLWTTGATVLWNCLVISVTCYRRDMLQCRLVSQLWQQVG